MREVFVARGSVWIVNQLKRAGSCRFCLRDYMWVLLFYLLRNSTMKEKKNTTSLVEKAYYDKIFMFGAWYCNLGRMVCTHRLAQAIIYEEKSYRW